MKLVSKAAAAVERFARGVEELQESIEVPKEEGCRLKILILRLWCTFLHKREYQFHSIRFFHY